MSTVPTFPLQPLDIAQAYTVPEGIAYLRTSRPTLYQMIRDGSIRTITRGRRRLIPGSEIARLSRLPETTPTSTAATDAHAA